MSQYPPKGKADNLELGDWNAVCWECGRKFKASQLLRHWQGYYLCPEHWEPRQPQDFVRGVPDKPAAPWIQQPSDEFVADICDIQGISCLADYAMADCAICDLEPSFVISDSDLMLAAEDDEDDLILSEDGQGIFY